MKKNNISKWGRQTKHIELYLKFLSFRTITVCNSDILSAPIKKLLYNLESRKKWIYETVLYTIVLMENIMQL